jgi:N-acetylglutamate synthase-like GNAT family acetyltransferase
MSAAAINRAELPANITIRQNLQPGDIGYITYLHGVLYAKEYGWDHTLEAYVAPPLAKFATSQTSRERIWIVEKDGEIAGSIAIVESSKTEAQLRWLLLCEEVRGYGIGRLLVEEAVAFCRECGYSSVFLWTVRGLSAAAHLYESAGFQLTEEKTHEIWGAMLTEQRFDLKL